MKTVLEFLASVGCHGTDSTGVGSDSGVLSNLGPGADAPLTPPPISYTTTSHMLQSGPLGTSHLLYEGSTGSVQPLGFFPPTASRRQCWQPPPNPGSSPATHSHGRGGLQALVMIHMNMKREYTRKRKHEEVIWHSIFICMILDDDIAYQLSNSDDRQ